MKRWLLQHWELPTASIVPKMELDPQLWSLQQQARPPHQQQMAIIPTFQGFLYLSNADAVPELKLTSAGDRKLSGNFSALPGVLGDEGLI